MGTLKDMLKKLERFQQDVEQISKISIPIIPDKNGMIDRQCPKSECESLFKIHKEDWLNIVRDEEVFCPFCKNNSEAKSYLTIEQNNEVIGDLKKSIRELWHYGYSTTGKNITIKPRPEFELNIKCEKCNCRYSVVASKKLTILQYPIIQSIKIMVFCFQLFIIGQTAHCPIGSARRCC